MDGVIKGLMVNALPIFFFQISNYLCLYSQTIVSISLGQRSIQKRKTDNTDSQLWWFRRKCPPNEVKLLVDVALLEQKWSCWRKNVTEEVGFKVSNMFNVSSSFSDHLLLHFCQDVGLQATSPAQQLPACYHVTPLMTID